MSHYATLEISEQATPDDIRRAYRRLVLLTHPDRTPDPAQHRRYLAINEAYEILSNPARRQRYDLALHQPATPPEAASTEEMHPDPALRRRGRPRPAARQPVVPLHIRYAEEFSRLLPRFRFVAVLGLLGALLVIIDFSRTQVLPLETVQDFEYMVRGSRPSTTTYFIVSTQQAQFETETTTKLERGDQVIVYQTPWFNKVRQVTTLSGEPNGVQLRPSNFGYAWLLVALQIGSAAATLYPKLRLDHAFNVGFANSVATLLLVLYILFM